jgi:hypothetical protein
MDSFREVIALWPTAADLGSACGVDAGTVRSWKARNSIPPEHWPAIVQNARAHAYRGVTLEGLAALVTPRKRKAKAA